MTKQAEAESDYQMVVKWMKYEYIDRLHIKYTDGRMAWSGYVVDGWEWSPKEILDFWPDIYDNMTDLEWDKYESIMYHNNFNKSYLTWKRFLHNCPAITRYESLVQMIKDIKKKT